MDRRLRRHGESSAPQALSRRFRRWLTTLSPSGRSHAPVQTREWRSDSFVVFSAFGAVLGVLLGLILAIPTLSTDAAIAPGAPSPQTIRAPRSIEYRSDVLTRRAQETAASTVTPVEVDANPELRRERRSELMSLLDNISKTRNNDNLTVAERAETIATTSTLPVTETLALQIVELNDAAWRQVTSEVERLYDEIWRENADGLNENEVARERAFLPERVDSSLSEEQRKIVVFFVNAFLAADRVIDQDATEQRRAAARARVDPVGVTVVQGENIVREGDLVTEETYEKLQKLGLVLGTGGIIAFLQQFLLGLLTAWLFTSYLYFYKAQLAENRRGLAAICLGMVVMLLAGRLLIPTWDAVPYVFPLAVVGVLFAVLFDGQVGLIACLALAPLLGLQSEQSLGLALTLALGSAAGVFAAQRATRSIAFLWIGLAVSLVTMLTASIFWVDALDRSATWTTLNILTFSVINGTLATALSLGLYQPLGRLARVITPLQLMELAHPSQPLLHRLMREAPGTHHHSIVVANLAEVAAENIGADPLLARVGAYYHDVGKLLRPYFFSDNQYARSNVHDVIDARTSASVIIDHVREGVKLARSYGLPEQIVDFIQQHHGTSVVSHFYKRALQEEEEDVNIEDFRYPGPKPQTREAGILMLADSIEAIMRSYMQSGKVRTIRPDEDEEHEVQEGQTIPEIVEFIINERVRTGQLDECALTLRDIATIKESFIQTLRGIYHPRVDYP